MISDADDTVPDPVIAVLLRNGWYIVYMMSQKAEKKHKMPIYGFRRMIAAICMITLLFNIMPDVSLPGLIRVNAANSIMDLFLRSFVALNLGDAAGYSEIDDDLIREAIKQMHTDGTDWSSVRLPAVLEYLGEQIADTVSVNGAATKINPWTTQSASSNGSPYAPGKDYNGMDMNTGYTLGQLILDYIRATETMAIQFTDDEIIEMYDHLVGGDDDDPVIDYDQLLSSMRAAVAAAGTGSYSDQPANDAIDTSNMIRYGEYVMKRGTPVPGGYLFIGTWLIDAQVLNATVYRSAVNSMTDYDQPIMYYKSELAGNNWRDISGATGIEDILPLSENIQEASLINYWVSVVIEADGIPVSAKTGDKVDIFNIVSPYDIENLPELKSLKLQYQAGILDDTDSSSKKYLKDAISKVFNRDGRLERNPEMEADCKYVMNVAGRTGIAFYAADPFYVSDLTALAQRGGLLVYANGISSTAGLHQWRFEESGRGYLESVERETDYYPNRRNRYANNNGTPYQLRFANGTSSYPDNREDLERILIRGSVVWTNERAWEREINEMGGIEAYRRRVWNFQDMWTNFSCIMDEQTDELDERLSRMSGVYTELRGNATAEDIELADEAMLICERLDAMRRARAYYNLVENEDHNYVIGPVLNLLYEWVNGGDSHVGNNYKLNMYTTDEFSPVASITEAVENAITACDASYIKYNAMAIAEGSTITSQTEYDLTTYVIENAASGTQAIRAQLRDLVDLENVKNGVVAHKSRELNFLNGVLIVADSKFSQFVHQAAGEIYLEAAADPNTTKNVLDELLKDQKADVSSVAAELQRFIKAKSLRLATEDAIAFVEDRINWADGLYAGISVDVFGPYAKEALKEHIDWLKELLTSIKEGGEILDEAGELELKKAELQTEYLNALDENDLKTAEALERDIENTQRALDAANDEKNKTVASGTATAAEVANAQVNNTARALADKIVDDALGDIADNRLDDIPDTIEALEDLGSPRLGEVFEALQLHGAPPNLLHMAEDAMQNLGDSPFADQYPELGTGTGDGDGGIGDGTGGNGDGDGGIGDPDGNNVNGNGGDGDNNNGNGDNNGGNGTGGGAGDGDNNNGNGDDNGGDGTGGGGNGNNNGNGDGDNNNTGGAGDGDGSGGPGGGSPEAPDYGPGTGLKDSDFDRAMADTFGKDFSGLNDGDKVAAIAALIDFANARNDKAAYDHALDLLDELLLYDCPFIYRQYVSDYSREYVSLAAVDKCRRYTKFRMVQKELNVTMTQFVKGSASYVFSIGTDKVDKNNGKQENMEKPAVSQTDKSIRGSSSAKYAYIPENNSGKLLFCTCAYIPGTEWAILITPQIDKKIAQLLDRLDLEADGE